MRLSVIASLSGRKMRDWQEESTVSRIGDLAMSSRDCVAKSTEVLYLRSVFSHSLIFSANIGFWKNTQHSSRTMSVGS